MKKIAVNKSEVDTAQRFRKSLDYRWINNGG